MVTIIKGEEELHEVVPDGVFRNWAVMSLGLFDDAREVAAAAVLHKDVEDASFSVDIAVMVSDNILVVQVFQNISGALG